MRRLEEVLERARWACSGTWTGQPPLDQVFAERFAAFTGTRFCVPTDHGSSAIAMALEAFGVGRGDEVIVPGLTWVACASAVLRAGARPVLVDILPETLCLDPAAVEAAITPRTAAILVVHLYSAMADMDALGVIARRHGLPILEDSAQAHGASWRGRPAGSLGDIGVFSMQQGKVLTCGEGGAAVTSDPRLYSFLERLRNDGRRYSAAQPDVGHMQLKEIGGLLGRNYGLSEFQLAVLLDGLDRLEEENLHRARNADVLTGLLEQIDGLEVIRSHPQNDRRTYYHYPVRIRPDTFSDCPLGQVCSALEAELGAWVHSPYAPLNRHPLLPAIHHRSYGRFDPSTMPLPEAERQSERTVLFHHSMLLGERADMELIAAAFVKVMRLSDRLASEADSPGMPR